MMRTAGKDWFTYRVSAGPLFGWLHVNQTAGFACVTFGVTTKAGVMAEPAEPEVTS